MVQCIANASSLPVQAAAYLGQLRLNKPVSTFTVESPATPETGLPGKKRAERSKRSG